MARNTILHLRISEIMKRLHEAENAALEQTGTHIVQLAKSKAPVRKIYSEGGKRRRSRAASPELLAAAIRSVQNNRRLTNAQRTSALYLLQRHPESARVAVRRHNSANAAQRRRPLLLGQFKNISTGKGGLRVSARVFQAHAVTKFKNEPALDHDMLRSRGRYEIRSGRAWTNEAGQAPKPGAIGQVRVGGRLKASISKGAIDRQGTRATIQVGTDVPYAIYVEFPTRHNAAQPFLLPALHEARGLFPKLAADELRARGLRKG